MYGAKSFVMLQYQLRTLEHQFHDVRTFLVIRATIVWILIRRQVVVSECAEFLE
jgi:hypothetical protein